MEKYTKWIQKNYSTALLAKTQCSEATVKMSKEFSELKRVRGQILVEEPYGLPATRTTHWWLETPENKIIDPTGHQYPTRIIKYIPVDESKGEPSGKCPNCGDLCYNGEYFCSKICNKAYLEYLNKPSNDFNNIF